MAMKSLSSRSLERVLFRPAQIAWKLASLSDLKVCSYEAEAVIS